MTEPAWKRVERIVCRFLHGERSGAVGREGPDCTDDTYPFSAQVKHGQKIPKWFVDDMKQTVKEAYDGYIPTLILHPTGGDILDSIVCFRLRDIHEFERAMAADTGGGSGGNMLERRKATGC